MTLPITTFQTHSSDGKCWECNRGFCTTCLCNCTCTHSISLDTSIVVGEPGNNDVESEDQDNEETDNNVSERRERRNKPDDAITDQQSTGRKRAAKLYPLDPTKPCEWRGKVNQGGGTTPILGCIEGMQQARHHGPDKNTLNNEPGNVHRICHYCHNNWHAKNDSDYDPNKTLKD